MKRIHLLLIALMLSYVASAQTRLTSPQAGSLTIQNPSESLITTYPVDKLYFSLSANNVRIYLLGTGPSSSYIVANNNPSQYLLNGAAGTDTASVKAYLVGLGVGKAPAGGGGGGGGATTIADGADVAEGSRADAPATTDNGSASLIALQKRLLQKTKPLVARTPTAVTVGTTSTALTSANAAGYRVFIQNNGTNDIWISIGGTATLAAPSIRIIAGGSYMTSSEYPDTQAISAITTVSQAITVMTY